MLAPLQAGASIKRFIEGRDRAQSTLFPEAIDADNPARVVDASSTPSISRGWASMSSVVEAIRERGGNYFLLVKSNQPELEAELKRAFGDIPPSGRDFSRSGRARRAA